MTNLKATAEQIGNTKKERVLINGIEFLKSVQIGRWNYVMIEVAKGEEQLIQERIAAGKLCWFGKSANRASAEKWQSGLYKAPYINILINGMQPRDLSESAISEFMANYPTARKQRINRCGVPIVRLVGPKPELTCLIVEIER